MKQKTVYLCNECGYEHAKWFGKCPSCGAWNSMSEFKVKPEPAVRGVLPAASGGPRVNKPVTLDRIDDSQEERFHSGIGELDRVLGGGA